MPITVLTDAGIKRTYDKVEIDNLVGNGLGVVNAGMGKRAAVTVAAAGWTADTTGYKDAADLSNQEFYYADLAHNLAAEVAVAVAGKDIDGYNMEPTQFQKQISVNTLRIWLARQPGAPTVWLVLA